MKKKITLIIAVILLLVIPTLLFVGCNKSYSTDDYYDGAAPDDPYNKVDISSSVSTADRKIVYTAYVTMTVEDIAKSLTQIKGMLNEDEWVESSRESQNYSSLTLRVKSERVYAFIETLKEVGTVESSEVSSKDVSLGYYDTTSRKELLLSEKEKLLELKSLSSTNINDLLIINQRLSEVESELKDLENLLNRYDSSIEYSTINISVSRPYEYEKSTFKDKLVNAYSVLGSIAEFFAIFFIVVLPIGVVVTGIVLACVFGSRKSKAKKLKKAQEQAKANAEKANKDNKEE